MKAIDVLRHHVTGAIERGEATAIVEIPADKPEMVRHDLTRPAPEPAATAHICQDSFLGCGDMKAAYRILGILATSTEADIFLVRSHVAYWTGNGAARRAVITASRGSSYRVKNAIHPGHEMIVRVVNAFDHRDGVTGWNDTFEDSITREGRLSAESGC